MSQLQFCRINAAENKLIEDPENPIELWPSRNEEGETTGKPANMHNMDVMMKANIEYLNLLLATQKYIKKKYEPQLMINIKVKNEPEDLDSYTFLKKIRKLLRPGTDSLYYV